MNATGWELESAQSAIAANFTASLSRTRSLLFLRTRPASAARRSLRPVLIAGPKTDQLHPLGLGQRRVRRCRRRLRVTGLLHPFPQSHLVDTDVPGHLGYRPVSLDDELNRFRLVLIGEAAACRTHSRRSRQIGQPLP